MQKIKIIKENIITNINIKYDRFKNKELNNFIKDKENYLIIKGGKVNNKTEMSAGQKNGQFKLLFSIGDNGCIISVKISCFNNFYTKDGIYNTI